jgi:hypothetical protein
LYVGKNAQTSSVRTRFYLIRAIFVGSICKKVLPFRQLPLYVVMPQAALALTCGYENLALSGKTQQNRLNCDFNRFCPLRALL